MALNLPEYARPDWTLAALPSRGKHYEQHLSFSARKRAGSGLPVGLSVPCRLRRRLFILLRGRHTRRQDHPGRRKHRRGSGPLHRRSVHRRRRGIQLRPHDRHGQQKRGQLRHRHPRLHPVPRGSDRPLPGGAFPARPPRHLLRRLGDRRRRLCQPDPQLPGLRIHLPQSGQPRLRGDFRGRQRHQR